MPYYIYILHCTGNVYYTGRTTDLKRRVREHASGKDHRAFTFSRRPVRLVWFEEVASEAEARQREKAVKALPRRRKEALIQTMQIEETP